jgi:transcriptional regulator with XRE-family HTH domain
MMTQQREKMKLGSLLAAYRNVNRLSLRELAPIIGLSLATLHRVEQNKQIDQSTMLLLINWMFGGNESNELPNTSDNTGSLKFFCCLGKLHPCPLNVNNGFCTAEACQHRVAEKLQAGD